MIDIEQKVKSANKDLFNVVGSCYEQIDGRRTEQLVDYVANKLKVISQETDGGSILDLGCGSGFVSNVAGNFFKKRFALDISFKIVKSIADGNLLKITADTDSIPVKTGTFSSVAAFALLHHCYSYKKMFAEIYRVLKKGGFFYSDHDLDSLFVSRYKALLVFYRIANNPKKRYLSRFSELSDETYRFSEIHQDGIRSELIEPMLKSVGFERALIEYHWYGLSPISDRIFGKRVYRRGNAPLVRIIAKK